MKLSALKPNPSAEVELKYAPGVFVMLASRDSDAVKAVVAKNVDRRIAAIRKGTKGVALSTVEAEAREVLKVAIIGIRDTTEDPMEFSPETVDELLAVDWVRRQLDEALGDESLFFGN